MHTLLDIKLAKSFPNICTYVYLYNKKKNVEKTYLSSCFGNNRRYFTLVKCVRS